MTTAGISLILAILKLTGVITISWFWVFLPVIADTAIAVLTAVICFIIEWRMKHDD